jgi:hypothetical protein
MKINFIAFLMVFSGFVNASVINVDFNSPDSLDSFNANNSNEIEHRSSGGVGGTGGVGGFYVNSIYKLKSFDFSSIGTQITVSAFYKMAAELEPAQPGYGFSFSQFTLAPESNSYIYQDNVLFADVNRTYDSVQLFGGALQKGGGVFDGFVGNNPTGIILANRWYQFGVTFTNLGDDIGYQFKINDFGLDGTSLISEVLDASFKTGDTHNIGKDKSVYAGATVIGFSPTFWRSGSSVAMDNFSISYVKGGEQVSVPGTLSLFLIASCLLFRRFRHQLTK